MKSFKQHIPEAKKASKNTSQKQALAYDKTSAKSTIDTWERDMDRLKDHIEFLQSKHKTMGQQLANAKKRFQGGEYGWILQNLYTLGDLY